MMRPFHVSKRWRKLTESSVFCGRIVTKAMASAPMATMRPVRRPIWRMGMRPMNSMRYIVAKSRPAVEKFSGKMSRMMGSVNVRI